MAAHGANPDGCERTASASASAARRFTSAPLRLATPSPPLATVNARAGKEAGCRRLEARHHRLPGREPQALGGGGRDLRSELTHPHAHAVPDRCERYDLRAQMVERRVGRGL